MPRCVHCNAFVPQLLKTENGTRIMCSCPHCHAQSVDPYMECTAPQLLIDIALLHNRAWSHILFNAMHRATWLRLALVVIATYLLEVYVAEVLLSYSTFLQRSVAGGNLLSPSGSLSGSAAEGSALSVLLRDAVTSLDGADELYTDHGPDALLRPSLQLIPNIHSPRVSLIQYSRMPLLLAYGLLEFLFSLVGLAWCGSWLVARHVDDREGSRPGSIQAPREQEGGIVQWTAAAALASASNLLYAAFLVWDIPVYLTVVVDITYFLWLLQAVQTVAPQAKVRSVLLVVVATAVLRCFFRRVTRWCPFFVSSEAFPLAIVS